MTDSVVGIPSSLEKETEVPETESELRDKLDILILAYLNLIDTYQVLQSQINNNFSSGFINIAKANFESTRRYDQNSYDERMKTTKCLSITNNTQNMITYEIRTLDPNNEGASETVVKSEAVNPQNGLRQRKTPMVDHNIKESTSQPEKKAELDLKPITKDHDGFGDNQADDPQKSHNDPLRWFGILVPSALRIAQTSFSDSLSAKTCIKIALPMLAKKVSLINRLDQMEIQMKIVKDQLQGLQIQQLGDKAGIASLD